MLKKVFLPRLSKDHAIDGKRTTLPRINEGLVCRAYTSKISSGCWDERGQNVLSLLDRPCHPEIPKYGQSVEGGGAALLPVAGRPFFYMSV
jgi:hypothetical protein